MVNPTFEVKNEAWINLPISQFAPLGEIRGSKTLEIKVDQSQSKLKTGRDGDTPRSGYCQIVGRVHPPGVGQGRSNPNRQKSNLIRPNQTLERNVPGSGRRTLGFGLPAP